jgi:thymidylate synthase (FAD)
MIEVKYVDHMGDDLRVVNSARISMAKNTDSLQDKDEKLIEYLAKHQHMTPFEHNFLTVIVECPLDIRSQIMRHRTFSYNEVSRRYTSADIKLFTEKSFRKQHNSSKQCSDGNLSQDKQTAAKIIEQKLHDACLKAYQDLLDVGVSREQARRKLPISLMTKFYMSGNLRNWSHFLKLRLDSHAQEEAQIVAQQVKDIILNKFPFSGKTLLRGL